MLFRCFKGMRMPFDISPAPEIFHTVIAYVFKVRCIETMVTAVLNWAMASGKENGRPRQELQRVQQALQSEL